MEIARVAGPVGGLTPTWNVTVGKLLDEAMPFIRNGTIVGLFLGDEPCCMGVPAWALDTVASFCKSKIGGTQAFVYVNECGRPFDPRLAYNGSFRTSNGMRVPQSLDIISIDMSAHRLSEFSMEKCYLLLAGAFPRPAGSLLSAEVPPGCCCRRYCPSGSISTDPTPGQPPPVPLAGVPRCAPSQDYTKAALEPVVARAFYEKYIYPLLGTHQSVGIVPGT
eukprot:COSAG06_NODE_4276_length_4411_cov_1.926716_2_plen_221_part_00